MLVLQPGESLMTPNSTMGLASMAPLYEQALPVRSDRVFVFSLLLDSIAFCEGRGSAAWSVTQLADGFRLNVGQVEVMTCRFTFWLRGESELDHATTQVNLRILLAGEDCLSRVALPHESGEIYEMSYKPVGEPHWCYEGRFYSGVDGTAEPSRAVVVEHVAALRANHHAFLQLAWRTSTGKLRQKSNFARAHCEALYEYAVKVVGDEVPTASSVGVTAAPEYEINPLVRIRIEKAASDSGYELSPVWSGGAATLRSVQFPESVRVQHRGGEEFCVSASNSAVLLQGKSQDALEVAGWTALYEVLGKIAASARTLPNRVAKQFFEKTASLPKSTEAERWVVQRVGQNLFRAALLDYWQGKCCVTGLDVQGLLRASHIKPWAACASDEERLDVYNGLLLAPHLDALFDGGWISFTDKGAVLLTPALHESARKAVSASLQWQATGLLPSHAPYLAYHRQHVWRGDA